MYTFQVKLGAPDISNATVSLPSDEVIESNDEEVYINDEQDSVEVGIGGELPVDAVFIGELMSLGLFQPKCL